MSSFKITVHRFFRVALIPFIPFISSCASTLIPLSEKGTRVQIPKKVPIQCRFLGDISTHAKTSDIPSAQNSARNDLLNKTAEMAGDTAIIDTMITDTAPDYTGRYQVKIEGRAFYCKPLSP